MGRRRQWRRPVGPGTARPRRPAGRAARSRGHHPPRPGPAEAARCRAAAAPTPRLFGLIAPAAGGVLAVPGVYTVQPDELAVELRFGKPKNELSEPGPAFPLVADRDGRNRQHRRKADQHRRRQRDRGNSGLMLSGDQNIVDVQFSVAYQVSDPKAYLFNVADPGRHGAAGRRERHARGGRPPPGAGHLPR